MTVVAHYHHCTCSKCHTAHCILFSISVQNEARARNARAALRMHIEVGHSVSKVAADLDTLPLCRTEFDHCLRRIQGISKKYI